MKGSILLSLLSSCVFLWRLSEMLLMMEVTRGDTGRGERRLRSVLENGLSLLGEVAVGGECGVSLRYYNTIFTDFSEKIYLDLDVKIYFPKCRTEGRHYLCTMICLAPVGGVEGEDGAVRGGGGDGVGLGQVQVVVGGVWRQGDRGLAAVRAVMEAGI